jgi:hypothetical protein
VVVAAPALDGEAVKPGYTTRPLDDNAIREAFRAATTPEGRAAYLEAHPPVQGPAPVPRACVRHWTGDRWIGRHLCCDCLCCSWPVRANSSCCYCGRLWPEYEDGYVQALTKAV